MTARVYEFADFRLDCDRFELCRAGRSLKLERMPMELLILLAEKNGNLVTRTEIAERLWAREVFVDTEHGINTAIRKIRQVLGDDPEQPRFIQTVTGKGYRFVEPIVAVQPSEASFALGAEQDQLPQTPGIPKPDATPNAVAGSVDASVILPVAISSSGLAPVPALDIRHRSRWGLIVVAIGATAVLGAGLYLHSARKPPPPPARQSDWTPVTDFSDSVVSPALSPDGHLLTFIRGSETFFGSGQVYAKLLPEGEPVPLTHDETFKMSPQFSPDGSRIAYTEVDPTAGWSTWVVPVLGGSPQKMLANSEGLTWIDETSLLFSEIRKGLHMVLVTAGRNREGSRDVFVPPHERGMAHRSAISADHQWVLVVQMDNGGWLPCRLVPLDGSTSGRIVGPPDGGCTDVAWSPDQAWMYFSSDAGGHFHIWRQAFPGGAPEQITSGVTEEQGIAIAPDGHSLITAVGQFQSAIMLHGARGDRELTSETVAYGPRFSNDGKSIYYFVPGRLVADHHFSAELFRVDVGTGSKEHLLPGVLMNEYAISPDGKRAVFSAADEGGHSHLWVADLDLHATPRLVHSMADEDQPAYDESGKLYFRASEGGSNFLYSMKEDGSDRRKILPNPIIEMAAISPNGRWAVVRLPKVPVGDVSMETVALPLGDGTPVTICTNYCDVSWGDGGRLLAIHLYPTDAGKTLFVQVSPGAFPELPAGGLDSGSSSSSVKGSTIVEGLLNPGPIGRDYAWERRTVHRNLYRIPLQ